MWSIGWRREGTSEHQACVWKHWQKWWKMGEWNCCWWCPAGPSVKLLFRVLLSVPLCLSQSYCFPCQLLCMTKKPPLTLIDVEVLHLEGKGQHPLQPLSSFWLGTTMWSLVMSFARRQQLKSSGRALLLAVRSDNACECPVHHLHCEFWQVPLPGVSDLMTCRVRTKNYFLLPPNIFIENASFTNPAE